MVKLEENSRGYKLSRKDVPFTNLVVERTNTNPDWINQPSQWGPHYFLDKRGLHKALTEDMRASGEKDYNHDDLVVFQTEDVDKGQYNKALQTLSRDYKIPGKQGKDK